MNLHPLAHLIKLRLQKTYDFLARGLYELTSLQAKTNSAERFAIDTYDRFLESFAGLTEYEPRCSVYCKDIRGNIVKYKQSTKPELYQVFIIPIDNPFLLSRGKVEKLGAIIYARSVDITNPNEEAEPLFSIFYSILGNQILYSEKGSLSYLQNKRTNVINRNTESQTLIALNDEMLRNINLTELYSSPMLKIKNILNSGSIVDDMHFMGIGGLDIAIYCNLDPITACALKLFADASGILVKYLTDYDAQDEKIATNTDAILTLSIDEKAILVPAIGYGNSKTLGHIKDIMGKKPTKE